MKILFWTLGARLICMGLGATPVFVAQPSPRTNSVSVGASLVNRVTASSTQGNITFQWRLNGANLPGRTNSSLSLTNLQTDTAGVYTVVAADSQDSIESVGWVVDVDPAFTKIFWPTTTAVGNSSGVVWGDLNNDGFPELVVCANPLNVFTNQSGTNLTRISSTFLNNLNSSADATWVDYDNDGWTDLLITTYQSAVMARNVSGVLKSVTGAGLPAGKNIFGAAWADFDRDGNVDVFFTSGFTRGQNSLYQNRGGVFKVVTNSITSKEAPEYSQGAAWGDYDNDGWPDLFVPNARDYNSGAGRPSFLYHNNHGVLEKVSNLITTNLFGLACGVWGDFNNDGKLDLFTCGYAIGNSPQVRLLYQNEGNGEFTRMTNAFDGDKGYDQGAAMIDYDNDGWLDVFVASGGPNAFNDALYHNNGDGTFTRIRRGSLVNDQGEGAGCAWGDFNHDGFLDLYVTNFQNQSPEKNGFYLNNGNGNHWLEIKCVGRISNRSGIGAKVRVRATIAGREFWQMREVASTGSYMSGTSLEAHFGLGDAQRVDEIRIEWPSGVVQELGTTSANQCMTIEEPFRIGITASVSKGSVISSEGRGPAVFERSFDLRSWEQIAERNDTNTVIQVGPEKGNAVFYRLH